MRAPENIEQPHCASIEVLARRVGSAISPPGRPPEPRADPAPAAPLAIVDAQLQKLRIAAAGIGSFTGSNLTMELRRNPQHPRRHRQPFFFVRVERPESGAPLSANPSFHPRL